MAEFAGYVGSQIPPMDWSKITSDYTNKLISLNEQRKAEQEKIDDMEADALAKVGDIEITSSQPFNNFHLDVVDNYKQSIYMKSQLVKKGLLSKQDFRKSLITASSNTSVLNKFAKTYQEQSAMLIKAASENKLGKYGLKNKREVWRVMMTLAHLRKAARELLTLDEKDPRRIFEGSALMKRM